MPAHVSCLQGQHELVCLLALQQDAGGEVVITQLFYDVDIFLQYVKDCRSEGVTCPIIPGNRFQTDEPALYISTPARSGGCRVIGALNGCRGTSTPLPF